MKKRMAKLIGLFVAVTLTFQMPVTVLAQTDGSADSEKTVSVNTVERALDETDTSEQTEAADTDEAGEKEQAKSEIQDALKAITDKHPVLALVYQTSSYGLKAEPDAGAGVVCDLPSGSQLQILDAAWDEEDQAYYYAEAYVQGVSYRGYIEDGYVASNDAAFKQWRQEELPKIGGSVMLTEGSSIDQIYTNFPKGYWNQLIELSNAHPNWIFVPFQTGLEWGDVVAAERVGNRSLVYKTVRDDWKSKDPGDYDSATGTYIPKSGANWLRASETAVAHCLNPLNYLDEMHIFAFEQLTYNAEAQNTAGVYAIIRNSWMHERALEDGSGGLYCDVFMEIGSKTGVSPYHLASRVLQEQGVNGDAALISGYGGVYNYFNVKASGATEADILTTGTAYAQSQGWTTRYASLLGGAERLGANYITKGQDTLYLQKFDVESDYNGLYSHQYMQNIQAPTTESNSVYKAYSGAGAIDNGYVFKIPIYNNMPDNNGSQTYPISEDFIVRLYQVILDREPDAEGLQHWKNEMANGKSAADLVGFFFESEEMKNRNLKNEDYLDYAYRAILGREADAGGKAYWLSDLQAGCTRKYVLSGFVNSVEFTNLCKSYGVVKGDLSGLLAPADKNGGQTKFVVRLYRNIFNREADEGGLNHWTLKLQSGTTASEIIKGFVYSTEFANAKFSNEDYVEIMYKTLLGRASDAAGKADWVNRLNQGQSRNDILRGFVYSPEFAKMCAEYGIKVGTL